MQTSMVNVKVNKGIQDNTTSRVGVATEGRGNVRQVESREFQKCIIFTISFDRYDFVSSQCLIKIMYELG